jgi:phosphoesterase RecJ-like protein
MNNPDDVKKFGEMLDQAQRIVILQADNPDGDSLASSLALEAIFSEIGKNVSMVCGVDMPAHLRYLQGWDRVIKSVPHQFDIGIVVDASTPTLFETLEREGSLQWFKAKPVVVIDHHQESDGLDFAAITFRPQAVATSEVIYEIARTLGWVLPVDACEMMAVSIMSDSLGFVSEATTANTLRVVADLIEKGVSLSKLDSARRELMKREPELLPYKGKLLERVEFHADGQIASLVIPWEEIEKYSHLYNPSMLAIDDMRMTIGVRVAIAFKIYRDGKITGKIRCNHGTNIAGKLAAQFGGGGHTYAAGFKITDGRSLEDTKEAVITKAAELLSGEAS